jgi:hypothetical protein
VLRPVKRKLDGLFSFLPSPLYSENLLFPGFAKKFYDLIKYADEVLLQMSFVNVLNFRLFGFNEKYNDTNMYPHSNTANNQHNNFKLTNTLNPKNLTEADTITIAKHHSEKICRAFGLPIGYAFVDGKLSIRQMNDFYL